MDVPYRHVRYLLEEKILPEGLEENPGRGEHRHLNPAQAFWLGIVLKLKENGVRAALAGKIADYTEEAVRTVTSSLGWDAGFQPFKGNFATDSRWLVDLGDLKYVRLVTTGNPSKFGEEYGFPWVVVGTRTPVNNVEAVVTFRMDLSALGRLFSP